MKDPLGVSPSKGNQGTTRGKGKILFLPRWESTELRGRTDPEVVGSIPTEVKRVFLYLLWFPDRLY